MAAYQRRGGRLAQARRGADSTGPDKASPRAGEAAPATATELEDQEFQRNRVEAMRLSLGAAGEEPPEPARSQRLEVLQAKMDGVLARRLDRARSRPNHLGPVLRSLAESPPGRVQRRAAGPGAELPAGLKAGVESLSGVPVGDVSVHYDSPEPADFGALAFARGGEIHLASGQEGHLGHEAWHVAQQRQGRVQPTAAAGALGGAPLNDDAGLERDADVMGRRAWDAGAGGVGGEDGGPRTAPAPSGDVAVMQRVILGLEAYDTLASIPDQWVQAYLADVTDAHTHLYQQDILAELDAADPPWRGTAALAHQGGNHWDVNILEAPNRIHTVTARPDGSCGCHVVHAVLNRGNVHQDLDNYTAPALFIQQMRARVQQRLNGQDDEIRGRILAEIQGVDHVASTGFGPQLTALLLPLEQAAHKEAESGASSSGASGESHDAGTVAGLIANLAVRLGLLAEEAIQAINPQPSTATQVTPGDIVLSFCVEFEDTLQDLRTLPAETIVDQVFKPELWSACYNTAARLFKLLRAGVDESHYANFHVPQAGYTREEMASHGADVETRSKQQAEALGNLVRDMALALKSSKPRIYNCGYGIHGFALIARAGRVELLQSFANGLQYGLPGFTIAQSIRRNKVFEAGEMLELLQALGGNEEQRAAAQQTLFATTIETPDRPFPLLDFYWEADFLAPGDDLMKRVAGRLQRNVEIMRAVAAAAKSRVRRISQAKALLNPK